MANHEIVKPADYLLAKQSRERTLEEAKSLLKDPAAFLRPEDCIRYFDPAGPGGDLSQSFYFNTSFLGYQNDIVPPPKQPWSDDYFSTRDIDKNGDGSFDEEREFSSQPPQEVVTRQMAEHKMKNQGREARPAISGALLPAPQAVQLSHLSHFGTRFTSDLLR